MESFNHYQPPTTSIPFDIQKKFHVFLSFRGTDVREGFVDHLYNDLSKAGLRVFLDSEELEKGKDIDPALQAAIDKSDIHIPVFSEGYADSTWCLREAARMCTSKALIIPFFYKIQPYNVRYPEKEGSPYAKAFKNHYSHLDRHPKNTIDQWKEALHDICNKSGWSLQEGSGSETRLVKRVVRDVLDTVRNVPFPAGELPLGLERDKNEIVQKLNLEMSDRVMKIGICGSRGVGKTTLTKAVYNEIHRKFDACSFVFNVRISAKDNTRLMGLQRRILKDIVQYPEEVPSVDHGIYLMRDRLRGRRALVILDDVDHWKQLDALAGDWFGPGSRVVIISRDQNILNRDQNILIHSISRLAEASPLVFAHYMLYYPESIDVLKDEIRLAASRGIDAFALNSNVWREDRADAIYEAARQASPSGSFKLFFSADMHEDDEGSLSPDDLVTTLTRYRNHPNQLTYKGRQFFSAWLGDDDARWKEYGYPTAFAGWEYVFRRAGGLDDFFFVPFFPTDGSPLGVRDMIGRFRDVIDGLFAWDTSAWPYFTPDLQNPSDSRDRDYMNACATKEKVYMASVSPWFFNGRQVKGNYEGPGLWIKKWKHLIDLKPHFVQILTWNNWWESSYVAPPLSRAAAEVADFSHRAFLELGQHFIRWYKTGKEPDVMEDALYMFYYTHSKSLNGEDCGETHIDQLSDELYVTAMLTEPATVELRSGDAYKTFNAEAGMSTWSMNFHEGQQAALVRRGGCVVKRVEGSKAISNSKVSKCNFNVYSTYA